jgi:putative glutamine amidotransferase
MRVIIGIPCRLASDAAWCPELVGLRRGYVDALLSLGATPVLIPPQADENALRNYYELADAILLSGGVDLAPETYGEQPHPKLGAVDALRDRTELLIARWAIADRKPLLGVCRGMQTLNIALGGTLYQDIGSQYTTSIEHDLGSKQESWRNFDHAITLEADSRLAELLGAQQLDVNSLHHQALKDVAPELRVVGRAPDGIAEAVEGVGDGFVMAVQCHPEELWQETDTRWLNLFRALVEAGAARREQTATSGAVFS